MATKTISSNGSVATAAARPAVMPVGGPWLTPPWTTEERLRRIEAMGQRIHGFVDFMCKIGTLDGTCAAAKERAIAAFYDRLVVVERQLGKIQEDIQLG
jgi:hypothetical protein